MKTFQILALLMMASALGAWAQDRDSYFVSYDYVPCYQSFYVAPLTSLTAQCFVAGLTDVNHMYEMASARAWFEYCAVSGYIMAYAQASSTELYAGAYASNAFASGEYDEWVYADGGAVRIGLDPTVIRCYGDPN